MRSLPPLPLPVLSACLAVLSAPGPAGAGEYLLHAGRVFDAVSGEAEAARTILVRDERIISITPGYRPASGGQEIIDLRDHTVLPGLMDMHTHLDGEFSPRAYSEGFRMNDGDIVLRSSVFARRTLLAGFTTVRNLGDRRIGSTVSLRRAIEKGWVIGPRIHTAGKSIATTGGHADPSNGLNRELMGDPGPLEGVINSAADARQAVRQRYKNGADVIKLTVTGGVLSLARSPDNPQFTDAELAGVMEAARDYDFVVAVHAHGAEGMKRAIRAGVDSVEHGTFMDDEAMALMKEHGTWLVPTMMAGKWVTEKAEVPDYLPEIVRPKARLVGPQIRETVARAHREGVRIAFGTDAGVFPHGDNAQEFALLVEAGLSPREAILTATRHAAQLLRIDDALGTLAEGRLADIIAVRGDPLESIEILETVDFVMKNGTIYKRDGKALTVLR